MTETVARPNAPFVGAALGAGLATLLIGGLAVVVNIGARVPDAGVAIPDSALAIVFGLDGLFAKDDVGRILALAVGPVAAGIAGWVFASAAAASVEWAGIWMGSVTYGLAIAIAPLALLPSAIDEGGLARTLPTIPMAAPIFWLFAGAALAPLFVVCLFAGPAWAWMVRAAVGVGPGTPVSHRSLPILPVAAGAVLIGLGWVIASAMLDVARTPIVD